MNAFTAKIIPRLRWRIGGLIGAGVVLLVGMVSFIFLLGSIEPLPEPSTPANAGYAVG